MIKIKKEVRKMKDSDLIYYKYIDTLYNIDNAEININKPLLKLFNEYISSNMDFKYNKTYLDDSVEDFVHCINMFKNKRSFVEKTKKELLKEYKLRPPSKNGHKKASKNEMNRSISLIY